MEHFKGIVPEERWRNDVLTELRAIRELLERDSKTLKQEPEKRKYTRRGGKHDHSVLEQER